MKYVVELNGKQIGSSYSSYASARRKATDIWERWGEEAIVVRVGKSKRKGGRSYCRVCKGPHRRHR